MVKKFYTHKSEETTSDEGKRRMGGERSPKGPIWLGRNRTIIFSRTAVGEYVTLQQAHEGSTEKQIRIGGSSPREICRNPKKGSVRLGGGDNRKKKIINSET